MNSHQRGAVKPLATNTELNDSIREAVKPLATKTDLDAAVKLLATKESVDALGVKITDSNDALGVKITDSNDALGVKITDSNDALGVRITDLIKTNAEAIKANRVLIENSQFWLKILIPFLMLIITLFVVRDVIQIYDARSTSLSPTPIESADPSTPKQPEPSPGASSATGTEQTLETNSKTTVLPE